MSTTAFLVVPVLLGVVGSLPAAAAPPAQRAFSERFPMRVRATLVPREIVLRTASGSVVLLTSPFRYFVTDATGRNVLAAVATQTASAPSSYAVTSELPGVTTSPQATTPVYSPFTYTVGTSTIEAENAGPFQGNLEEATQTGTTYEATAVLSATHTATSANLVLATSESAERRVLLTIAPDSGGFRFTATFDHGDGVVGTGAAFISPSGEAFHGFGGRHNAVDEAGSAVQNYVEQENQNPADVAGAPTTLASTYLFPNGPTAAYYVQSQFISSAGYGFFSRRPELAEYRLDLDTKNAWLFESFSAGLDYTVSIGTPAAVIAAQTTIGGRQIEPPLWALGPEFDRAYASAETSASDYYTKVQSDLAYFAMGTVPVSSYRIEGASLLTAAQLQTTISTLHGLGIHALVYLNSYGGYPHTPISTEETLEGGYETKTAAGTPYAITTTSGSPTFALDYTNPNTVKFWDGIVDAAFDSGADGFMEDFGEQIMPDMYFANGTTGLTMHNDYPVLYHSVTRAAVDAYAAAHPGRELYTFVRSGYSQSAGYENANFPGDETTDFGPASGLASLAPDMLDRSVGGAYGFTTDIGGYFDFTGSTSKELFLRWAAWSALTPFFRLHNDGLTGTEMPWNIDADTVTKYVALEHLHDRFVPLIARLWQEADATGMPIVRPFWLADPGDAYGAAIDQEWFLGNDVVAAPVVTSGATTNAVYLPAGCWQEQNTMRVYQGRRTVTIPAPVGTLPYFFRCTTHPA